jgi:hypothetical protein
MRLNTGNAMLKHITFSGGTIEFAVNTIGRGMSGVAFRQQHERNFDLLYLRPDPACPAFAACIIRAADSWCHPMGLVSAISFGSNGNSHHFISAFASYVKWKADRERHGPGAT